MAGVRPTTEGTALTTEHYVAAQGIRFVNGFPQKIGGYESIIFDNSNTITGAARSMTSVTINGSILTNIGTHKRLYSLAGSTLTNITPLKTATTAAANSLATLYGTLANNPVTTVLGSKTLTIADASGARLRAGDTVTLSGASTTNGVPDTEINALQVVRSVAANGLSFTIIVSTAATSSGSGGGASVVRATGMIQLTKTAHGLADGDRVKITLAADTGGVTAAQINLEFIIRNVATDTWDMFTAGVATSSVSSAGGAATLFQPQIDAGLADAASGQGYGMGKYGVGLYGTSLVSTTSTTPVRIWHWAAERFSTKLLATAGNQTGLHEWDGVVTAAPVLVTNAPTTINYAFVSNNIVVTFGNGVENRIKTSDQGDRTNWTSSATNQVFVDDIEGAGRLDSHVNVNGVNLIFTKNQTFTFRYIGGTAVWEIKTKSLEIGIIAPMARCAVNGIAYWMGENNFYMWRGGNIEVIPANSQAQTTLYKYIFENLNYAQRGKIFMWHNEKFNEIQVHYPSATSNEPDRVARLSLQDYSWTPDLSDRTAAEYPNVNLQYPRLISSANVLYRHEKGTDADGAALSWSLKTNDKVMGKKCAGLVSIVPDSVQVGNISVLLTGRLFPQSSATMMADSYTVTTTLERIPITSSARIWNYTFSGSAVGQSWIMGNWTEELQEGAGA